jgi:hypothetical protein
MAQNRTFDTPKANRAAERGLSVGAKEMDAGRDAGREPRATDPRRPEPFPRKPAKAAKGDEAREDARYPAGLDGGEPLGAGTPAGVDVHDLDQPNEPQDDWGDPADEGALYSANHTRRPVKTEADRGQGKKTRTARKDQISRRS